MTTVALGEAIKKRRREFKMTQVELAMVSGTGTRFISDLENGKKTCVVGKTLQVLDCLGMEVRFVPKAGSE